MAGGGPCCPVVRCCCRGRSNTAVLLCRYSGKKICCSCPETKGKRDECVAQNGQENCADFIEAHKACLRKEGFTVA